MWVVHVAIGGHWETFVRMLDHLLWRVHLIDGDNSEGLVVYHGSCVVPDEIADGKRTSFF